MQAHVDSSLGTAAPSEAGYDQGLNGVYAARHILFQFPMGATQAQKDSVHKKAQGVAPQVTDKNFADMAKKYSADASAAQGGNLGVFNAGEMVPEFGNALKGLKPGQISPLVETQFGYHIIQRLPYAQVKADYDKQFAQIAGADAEKAFMAKLDSGASIQVKPGAVAVAKAAAIDASNHRKDNAVLTTFKGGTLTVSRFLMWLDQFPQNQRIPQQMQTAPDSLIEGFLKNLTTNELLVHQADSLHVTLTADEQASVYHDFGQVVSLAWNALGVDPKALADSGKSTSAREKLAAARVEALMDGMMSGKVQPVPIPTPLKVLLETKYDWKINPAGLDRATEQARQIRTSADSAKAANQPKSQVPLPGVMTPPPATTTTGGATTTTGGAKK
jgi:hypothetical protein